MAPFFDEVPEELTLEVDDANNTFVIDLPQVLDSFNNFNRI